MLNGKRRNNGGPVLAAEMLKLLRGRWMDRKTIAAELGIKWDTANGWIVELQAHGFLVEREGPRQAPRWRPTREYSVSTMWVGHD